MSFHQTLPKPSLQKLRPQISQRQAVQLYDFDLDFDSDNQRVFCRPSIVRCGVLTDDSKIIAGRFAKKDGTVTSLESNIERSKEESTTTIKCVMR